jgi:hypothetical protein
MEEMCQEAVSAAGCSSQVQPILLAAMQAGQTPTDRSDLVDALVRLQAAAQDASSSTSSSSESTDAIVSIVHHLHRELGGSTAGVETHQVLAAALKLPQVAKLKGRELR